MISTGSCPLCGVVPLRRLFAKAGRQFAACVKCGLEMQTPIPTPESLEAYYDAQFADGIYAVFTAAGQMKTMTARWRLKEIARWRKAQGRWLDVGCADGVFVREAAASGVQAEGVELSGVAASSAVAGGLQVRHGRLADVESRAAFDLISAFDVIEHVADPLAFLRDIVTRLRSGGHAVLTLPDKSCIFARLMGARWWFYIPDEHLHYFDRTIMRALLDKVGLETVNIGRAFKPLTYDYGLSQFEAFNPLIHRAMKVASAIIPARLRRRTVPLYIGEMMVIARKPAG